MEKARQQQQQAKKKKGEKLLSYKMELHYIRVV